MRGVRGITLTGLTLVLALSTVSIVSAAPAPRSLGLSAAVFDFNAAPGQTGKGELQVINEGDTPMAVKVYAANQVTKTDGTVTYETPAADVNVINSPASWVQVKLPEDAKTLGNVPYIELDPGQAIPVTFSVTVPDNAPPGDRQAILFFEMFEPEVQTRTGMAHLNARAGARIKTRVTGAINERLEVRPFTVPGFVLGDVAPYSFVVRNTGNVDALMSGRLLVMDLSGNELSSSQVLTETPVYAGTLKQAAGNLDLSRAAFGRFRVRLELEYPSAEANAQGLVKTIEEERRIWVVPVWLTIAAIVLVGVLALYFTWAKGRRSAERKMRAQHHERRSRERRYHDEEDWRRPRE